MLALDWDKSVSCTNHTPLPSWKRTPCIYWSKVR